MNIAPLNIQIEPPPAAARIHYRTAQRKRTRAAYALDMSPCGQLVKVMKQNRIHWIHMADLVKPAVKAKPFQIKHSFHFEI